MTADEFVRVYGRGDGGFGGYELIDGVVYPLATTPDVAVVRTDCIPFRAPEVQVEVGGSQNPAELQSRISAYFRTGTHAVCCIFPETRTIVVYTAREWRELTEQDHLEFPALLPGVGIPVSAIFEGI
jgi:Uma2 family endonuclease